MISTEGMAAFLVLGQAAILCRSIYEKAGAVVGGFASRGSVEHVSTKRDPTRLGGIEAGAIWTRRLL